MHFWPFFTQASTFQFPSIFSNTPHPTLQLRVLSFNIRYATSSPFTNEKPWPERFPLVLNQLQHETRFLDASIICLQEVLHNQLIDLLNGLNGLPPSSDESQAPADGPIWAHVGEGRDDGDTKGEYSPVIYPVNIFRLLHHETIWLSPTPDRPSKGWDAGSTRILTVAVLEYKSSGQRVLASATHLDNEGPESRKNSVIVILETLKRVEKDWATDNLLPIFLAGDFNSFPDQEAYLGMARSDYMYDLHEYTKPKRRYGEQLTYTGFDSDKDKDEQGRIDFIWLGPKDGVCSPPKSDNSSTAVTNVPKNCPWIVDGYAVLPNVFEDGVYLSDHRCVVGDLRLRCCSIA
ncbi:endonuclease/exonuclease/phosphatase family protein [Lentithecium fluviatile CBS 122367]|uniref:Endonuclease/exonuclease/phosphatase family protein n=1 Tax=Lentithecium fluviatile CBS 122367 TaxID=1168545 RepID=A0A6G1J4I6_9PLEO|nr:endonuclease/exonuclease/phosphatase family protein [Lentithecium fluviatile CBS 122367]